MIWINQHRRLLLFSAIVTVQVLLLVAIVAREEQRLTGLEIVLESRPVDPRDPLRGDFVILSYKAEDLSSIPILNHKVGDRIYVEFVDHGRFWEPVSVSSDLLHRIEWSEGQAFVLAYVQSGSPLRVSYPDLGTYFIPLGTGEPPKPPEVFVSISDDGVARIKRLEIDGLKWPD